MKKKSIFFLKKETLFTFILLLIIYSFTIFAFADYNDKRIEVFEVTKTVEILNNNIFNAREIAIQKCQKKAVKLALSKILSENSDIENITALKANIDDNTEQFIKSYRVLYETSFDKYYTVTISVDIISYNILNKLNITNKEKLLKIKIIAELNNCEKSLQQTNALHSDQRINEQHENKTEYQNLSGFSYRNLQYFVRFNDKLRNIENISEVIITEIMPNKRHIIVTFKKNAENLAKTLMLIDFKIFEINIDEIEDNFLKVSLTGK